MTRGVLLFAHDNDVFEYHRLVIPCAWFIKKHLGVPIALVTDTKTRDRLLVMRGADLIDEFVMINHTESNGTRRYASHDGDTEKTTVGQFLNKTRIDMYDLTPFDETVYMDLDYIVMNDSINKVWGSSSPFRINRQIETMRKEHHATEARLHDLGIPMYWSTVMYFRKSPEAELIFEGAKFVKDNYSYFSRLFRFHDGVFRNDIALSVVAHLMNSGIGPHGIDETVQSMPEPTLLFAWDDQPILAIDQSRAWFVGNIGSESRNNAVAYVQDQSVHVVNKSAFLRVIEPWVAEQLENADD